MASRTHKIGKIVDFLYSEYLKIYERNITAEELSEARRKYKVPESGIH